MHTKFLRFFGPLLVAFLVAGLWSILDTRPTYADGPTKIVLVNAARPQWDESPVKVCVLDTTSQPVAGAVISTTLTFDQGQTKELAMGSDGCALIPVAGQLSKTTEVNDFGVLMMKANPSVTLELIVTVRGPKPDMTGWVSGQTDVYWTAYTTYDPNEVQKWWKKNATVFVQVAHPAVIQSRFANGQRFYANYGASLPAGTPVKVFGMTGDAKWVDITVQLDGWSQEHFFFPSGDLSDKWPFPPANADKADSTGYVPATPWNWTDGKNSGIGEEVLKGRRDFYVRTAFPEIPEQSFINQRRDYGRNLAVNEKVTVNYTTPDGAWANIEHSKNGTHYFVPTKNLSVVWNANVKGQTQVSHTVTRGDTLSNIARHYGVTVDSLVKANGILNPNLIIIGQTLVVPAPMAP